MAHFATIALIFTITCAACSHTHAEVATPVLGSEVDGVREPRHLFGKKCYKYGTCGGFQGQQGHHGYNGGHQGGYQGGYQGYPGQIPINIAISQSQSSASQGGGGYGPGGNYGPNNYQYNYPGGHGGYGGYGGYGGFRPGYNNGYGSNNNQFNGNFYGGPGNILGRPGNFGGYGFNGPFFDEGSDDKPIHEDVENDAFAGAYARSAAGTKTG